MKTFKLDEAETGKVEYCVIRCHKCKNVFRHDINLGSFGKPMKNRMCLVCGEKVPIDEFHCLDHDPMRGEWEASFKSAKDI